MLVCCRYFFVDTVAKIYTEIQLANAFKVAISWPPAIVFITLALIFRVRVEKEISKSKAEVDNYRPSTNTTNTGTAQSQTSSTANNTESASSYTSGGKTF
jgi:hypothetical protein